MSYGRMTPALLAMLVGDVSNPGATKISLSTLPMWWGVFSADPTLASDPLTLEIHGFGYVRPQATWSQYSVTGLVNDDDAVFHGIPTATNVAAVGLFDAAVNGTLLAFDVLDAPVSFPNGGTWAMPSGQFFLGFDLVGL